MSHATACTSLHHAAACMPIAPCWYAHSVLLCASPLSQAAARTSLHPADGVYAQCPMLQHAPHYTMLTVCMPIVPCYSMHLTSPCCCVHAHHTMLVRTNYVAVCMSLSRATACHVAVHAHAAQCAMLLCVYLLFRSVACTPVPNLWRSCPLYC